MVGVGNTVKPLKLTGPSPVTVARTVTVAVPSPSRTRVRASPLSSVAAEERVTSAAP